MQEPTSRSFWDEKILSYVFESVFLRRHSLLIQKYVKKEENENTAADGTENPPSLVSIMLIDSLTDNLTYFTFQLFSTPLYSSSHNSLRGIYSTHPHGASFIYHEQYSGAMQMENNGNNNGKLKLCMFCVWTLCVSVCVCLWICI